MVNTHCYKRMANHGKPPTKHKTTPSNAQDGRPVSELVQEDTPLKYTFCDEEVSTMEDRDRHSKYNMHENKDMASKPPTDIVDGTKEGEDLFTCIPCNKWFYASSDFLLHLKTHSKSNQKMDIQNKESSGLMKESPKISKHPLIYDGGSTLVSLPNQVCTDSLKKQMGIYLKPEIHQVSETDGLFDTQTSAVTNLAPSVKIPTPVSIVTTVTATNCINIDPTVAAATLDSSISALCRSPTRIIIMPTLKMPTPIDIASTIRTCTPFVNIAPNITTTPIAIAPTLRKPSWVTNKEPRPRTTPVKIAPKVISSTKKEQKPKTAPTSVTPKVISTTPDDIAPKVKIAPTNKKPSFINIAPTTMTPVSNIAPEVSMTTSGNITSTIEVSTPILIARTATPINITPAVKSSRRRMVPRAASGHSQNRCLSTGEQQSSSKCSLCGLCLSSQVFLTYHLISQHARVAQREPSAHQHHTGKKQMPQVSLTPRVQAARMRCRYPVHQRRYNCRHCGFGFSTAGELTAHTIIHTGRDYSSCRTCVKGFLHEADLEKHLARHVITPAFIFDTRQVC